ncbi:unnamed protein product [Gordionus sp. m RMFG-2023]
MILLLKNNCSNPLCSNTYQTINHVQSLNYEQLGILKNNLSNEDRFRNNENVYSRQQNNITKRPLNRSNSTLSNVNTKGYKESLYTNCSNYLRRGVDNYQSLVNNDNNEYEDSGIYSNVSDPKYSKYHHQDFENPYYAVIRRQPLPANSYNPNKTSCQFPLTQDKCKLNRIYSVRNEITSKYSNTCPSRPPITIENTDKLGRNRNCVKFLLPEIKSRAMKFGLMSSLLGNDKKSCNASAANALTSQSPNTNKIRYESWNRINKNDEIDLKRSINHNRSFRKFKFPIKSPQINGHHLIHQNSSSSVSSHNSLIQDQSCRDKFDQSSPNQKLNQSFMSEVNIPSSPLRGVDKTNSSLNMTLPIKDHMKEAALHKNYSYLYSKLSSHPLKHANLTNSAAVSLCRGNEIEGGNKLLSQMCSLSSDSTNSSAANHSKAFDNSSSRVVVVNNSNYVNINSVTSPYYSNKLSPPVHIKFHDSSRRLVYASGGGQIPTEKLMNSADDTYNNVGETRSNTYSVPDKIRNDFGKKLQQELKADDDEFELNPEVQKRYSLIMKQRAFENFGLINLDTDLKFDIDDYYKQTSPQQPPKTINRIISTSPKNSFNLNDTSSDAKSRITDIPIPIFNQSFTSKPIHINNSNIEQEELKQLIGPEFVCRQNKVLSIMSSSSTSGNSSMEDEQLLQNRTRGATNFDSIYNRCNADFYRYGPTNYNYEMGNKSNKKSIKINIHNMDNNDEEKSQVMNDINRYSSTYSDRSKTDSVYSSSIEKWNYDGTNNERHSLSSMISCRKSTSETSLDKDSAFCSDSTEKSHSLMKQDHELNSGNISEVDHKIREKNYFDKAETCYKTDKIVPQPPPRYSSLKRDGQYFHSNTKNIDSSSYLPTTNLMNRIENNLNSGDISNIFEACKMDHSYHGLMGNKPVKLKPIGKSTSCEFKHLAIVDQCALKKEDGNSYSRISNRPITTTNDIIICNNHDAISNFTPRGGHDYSSRFFDKDILHHDALNRSPLQFLASHPQTSNGSPSYNYHNKTVALPLTNTLKTLCYNSIVTKTSCGARKDNFIIPHKIDIDDLECLKRFSSEEPEGNSSEEEVLKDLKEMPLLRTEYILNQKC